MASFGTKSTAALKGVHPDLVRVLIEAIKDTPIDFSINEGVRSLATQQRYYASGRAKKGPIITNADGVKNKSNHQVKSDGYGWAVDLYPFVNGEVKFNDEQDLKTIADHIKATGARLGIQVIWGGDWHSIIDKPHFELKK